MCELKKKKLKKMIKKAISGELNLPKEAFKTLLAAYNNVSMIEETFVEVEEIKPNKLENLNSPLKTPEPINPALKTPEPINPALKTTEPIDPDEAMWQEWKQKRNPIKKRKWIIKLPKQNKKMVIGEMNNNSLFAKRSLLCKTYIETRELQLSEIMVI